MRIFSVPAGLVLTATLLASSSASAQEWAVIEDPDAGADTEVLGDEPVGEEADDSYDDDVESLGAGPSGPSTGPSKGGAKGPSRGPSCQCDVPASTSLGGGWALGVGLCVGALALRTRKPRGV